MQKRTAIMGAAAMVGGMAFTGHASAQLLITEVQSNQAGDFTVGTSTFSTEDWFEVTNFGGSAVDLTGYGYNDDDGLNGGGPGYTFTDNISIAPGESIIFVEDMAAPTFRAWWGIDNSVQVHTYTGSGLGLGQNDAATFFDAVGNLVSSLDYSAGGFLLPDGSSSLGGHAGLSAGGPTKTVTAIWDPSSGLNDPRYTFAQPGVLGAFEAAFGENTAEGLVDVGSPGVVPEPTSLALLGIGGLAMFRRRRSN